MTSTRRILCGTVLTAFCLLTSRPARPAEPPLGDPNQPYDRLSMAVETPHVKWAKPSVTGPVEALVIAPCWHFRDTVELMQRLDLKVTPIMVSTNKAWYGAGEAMADLDRTLDELARLRLSDGRRYHVIVIGKVMWHAFPEWVRQRVLKKVVQGTGLVYVSPVGADDALKAAFAKRQTQDEKTVLDGIPLAALPRRTQKRFYWQVDVGPTEVRLSAYGQGRVAVVDHNDLDPKGRRYAWSSWTTPFTLPDGPWLDYYYAILARTIQWAGRRELPLRVSPLAAQGAELDRSALADGPVAFRISGAPKPPRACALKWRLRNARDEAVFAKQTSPSPLADGDCRVALPALATGLYVLDLWVLSDGRVAGWGSAAFHVKSPGLIGDLTLARPYFRKGEPVRGQVSLSSALPAGMRVEVDVRDRLGRLVALGPVKTSGTQGTFSLAIPEPIGRIFDVTARVRDRAGPVEERRATFAMPNIDRGNFMFFQWGSPSLHPRTRYATRELKRLGMTGYNDGVLHFNDPKLVRHVATAGARLGLEPLPYCTTFIIPLSWYEKTPEGGYALKKQGTYRCMSDPRALERSRRHLEAVAKGYEGFGVVAYMINEEGGVPPNESCFCDICLKGFRAYAKKKYGTLQRANQVWGTAYKSWDEARGGTLSVVQKTGRYERWLDQRLFMMEVYNRWQLATIGGVRSVDKDSLVGPECICANPHRSFDIPKMAKHWGTFGHNVDYMDAVKRSFLKPGSVSAFWSGNLPMEENYHRYWPWHTLLQGMTHIFWYPGYASSGLAGTAALFPDFRPFACYRQTGEEVREIRQGVGPLLIQGEMVLSPVAIHWSTLSYFVDMVHHPHTRWENALRDAFHALADSGFVYHYIGTPQIERGDLNRVKVFVLPSSQALTGKEAEAIRAFVRAGGLLVADFMPGTFDANGTRLPKSQLADVFGDAKELEVRKHGRGHAVLTGSTLKGYTGRRAAGDAGHRRGLVRLIAKLAGVKPWCRVEDAAGLSRGDTEITVFKHGDTRLLGLLRDPGVRAVIATTGGAWTVQRDAGRAFAAAETVVRLPKAYHVYDARRHDYLGLTDTLSTGLVKARAKVFGLLPCKLERLGLQLSSTRPKQGDMLTITATVGPKAARTCGLGVRLTVTGPDGKEVEHYARTLVMTGGKLTTRIGLALDEPTGPYTVTAEEVISGLRSQAKYVVHTKN